jgi:hypothetical protein
MEGAMSFTSWSDFAILLRMTAFLRYLAAAFLIGLIAVWGSENLFWSAPQGSLTPADLVLTWIAYSLAVAAVLSAVMATGIAGWRAVFLGGALMGWLVEGIVEGTMYEAFPFQLVWTPLAWHALITGLAVFGLLRASVRWPLWKQAAAWIGIGLFAALWAQFWPLERGAMPGAAPTAFYLAGLGLAVPLANILLDRIGTLHRPRRVALLAVPVLALTIWLLNLFGGFHPLLFALPLLVALTLWIMRRLGTPSPTLSLGAPAPVWRHFVFLLAPLVAVAGSTAGWQAAPVGMETNLPVAGLTVPAGAGLYAWLAWKAARAGKLRNAA